MTSAVFGIDPRGPIRKIVSCEEVTRPITDAVHGAGLAMHKVITLDCGHTARPNAIYSYPVGSEYRCYACAEGGRP